jgi:hypothetical protein
MTSPRRLMLTTMMTASLVGLALARPASAFTVTSPFGSQAVTVTVGTELTHGPIVCFDAGGGQRQAWSLGTQGTLNNDYRIVTNAGNDEVTIVSGQMAVTEVCGLYSLHSLTYGKKPDGVTSWRLDVSTGLGKDFIRCGHGLSDCYGDQDDDKLFAYSSTGKIHGGAGKDTLRGEVALGGGKGVKMVGGTGNDCLQDPFNGNSSTFDCGSGTDLFVSNPGASVIGCETPVMSCPAVIP